MGRDFKDDTKFHDVPCSTLAKELGISEDRVTAMNNNIENTSVGRLIASYDYMGGNPADVIDSLSDNSFAQDMLDNFGQEIKSTKDRLLRIIDECGVTSDEMQKVINRVVDIYKYPLIYICGQHSSGKITMAENLLGTKFRFLGSPLTRSYTHLLIMSDSNSAVEYNYPLGEYPYEILKEELVPKLLKKRCSEDMLTELKPIAKKGMELSDKSYVVYSDSPSLSALNIVCSNYMNMFPDNSKDIISVENEASIVSMSDVIIVMLSELMSGYNSKIVWLLRCGWERWRYDMPEHFIFVISKSDRYTVDEISSLREHYSDIIVSLAAQVIDLDVDKDKQFFDEIANRVCPYSSIYKITNEKNKNDASYNNEFYQKLKQQLIKLSDEKNRRDYLSIVLGLFKRRISAQSLFSERIAQMNLKSIIIHAENDFADTFKRSYDKVINVDYIAKLITHHNITRKQEDRYRLLSVVNSELANAVVDAEQYALNRMLNAIEENDSEAKEYLEGVREKVFMLIHRSADPAQNDYIFDEILKQTPKSQIIKSESQALLVRSAVTTAAATVLLPISALIPIVTFAASGVVASYYAQTNFEKNMAKKLVSSYNEQDVYKKLSDEIISDCFKPLQDELLNVVGNSTSKEVKKTTEVIDRILSII